MPPRGTETQPKTKQSRDGSLSTKPGVCQRLLQTALNWAEPHAPEVASHKDSLRHSRRGGPPPYNQKRRSRHPHQAPRIYTIVTPPDDFIPLPRSYGLPPGSVSEFEPQARGAANQKPRSVRSTEEMPADSPMEVIVDLKKLRRMARMGHEEGAAYEALQATNNDIGKALDMLPESDEEQEDILRAVHVPKQQPRTSQTSARPSRRGSPPAPQHFADDDFDVESIANSYRAPSPPPQRGFGSQQPFEGYQSTQLAPRASSAVNPHAEALAHSSLGFDLLSAGASVFRPTQSLVPMAFSPDYIIRQQQDNAQLQHVRANRQHQRDQAETDQITSQQAESGLVSRQHEVARVGREENVQDALQKTRLLSLATHHGSSQLLNVTQHDYNQDWAQRIQNEQQHRQQVMQEEFQRMELSMKKEAFAEKKRQDQREWQAKQNEEQDRRIREFHQQWHNGRMEYTRGIEDVNRSAGNAVGSWATTYVGRKAARQITEGRGSNGPLSGEGVRRSRRPSRR